MSEARITAVLIQTADVLAVASTPHIEK